MTANTKGLVPESSPRSAEEGQALPLVVLLVVLAAAAAVLVAQVGLAVDERARARTAADATALAGAAEGRDAAAEVARANGAELVSFRSEDGEVTVVVRMGRARAGARARREPMTVGPGVHSSPP